MRSNKFSMAKTNNRLNEQLHTQRQRKEKPAVGLDIFDADAGDRWPG
jgi:hypothetical protein